jgi:branched-chain amino acid transport system ATP-binding protein
MSLVAENLTVQIGGVRPLDRVNATIGAGVTGLVGPNGAGKTTFLNVLSGFVRPIAGSVRYDGTDLLAMSPHRRARWGLRRTFQQEQLALGLTAEENVLVAAEHLGSGMPAVSQALAAVGFDEPRRTVRELSMLERRLLELAKAFVGAPRLVVLDEPGAGLAETETSILARVITALAEREGVSVVLVDHDMELVAALCASLVVLDFGRVIASGETANVLAQPAVRRAYLGDEEL